MLSLLALYGPALLLAALPALWLVRRFWLLDRARPEPIRLVGRGLLYGFLAVIPAALIELFLGESLPAFPGLAGNFVQSFLVAGLVEESVKLLFILRLLRRRPESDERADGVVHAVRVSLGFALVENFLYGYDNYYVLLLRSVTAVPLHAVATGLLGVWIGRAGIDARSPWKQRSFLLRGLAIATLVHGLYNFVVMAGLPSALLVIPLLWTGWRILDRLYRLARETDARGFRAAEDRGEVT